MASAKLASAVAKIEGKKSQTSIGNVRETLKALETVIAHQAYIDGETDVLSSPLLGQIALAAEKQLTALLKKASKCPVA